MKDSEIPAFTAKVLNACKQMAKYGAWFPPHLEGRSNMHCCPLVALDATNREFCVNNLTHNESLGFVRGYDSREVGVTIHMHVLWFSVPSIK